MKFLPLLEACNEFSKAKAKNDAIGVELATYDIVNLSKTLSPQIVELENAVLDFVNDIVNCNTEDYYYINRQLFNKLIKLTK